uniref:Uncharacterized protein n=1 Tax=Anguilla anguilla TaxID=7936 RepID=A0A0E9VCB3_ANGAN
MGHATMSACMYKSFIILFMAAVLVDLLRSATWTH